MLSSVGQDDLEPYEYACEVPHKLFKFKSLSSAQNYLFLAMPVDRSLMFVFQVFYWLVKILFLVFQWLVWEVRLDHSFC